MYNKDLNRDLRLRLSENDMNWLISLAEQRNISVSELLRSIIGEYRRSLDVLKFMNDFAELRKVVDVHGDTKTDIDNKL